jgi:hypothetical protein
VSRTILTLGDVLARYGKGERDFRWLTIICDDARHSVVFENTDFRESVFRGSSIAQMTFANCELAVADFNAVRMGAQVVFDRCRLLAAKFEGAALSGVQFAHCWMHGAHFARSRFENVEVRDSIVRYAYFTDSLMIRTSFSRSDVAGVDLSRAVLVATDIYAFCEHAKSLTADGGATVDWASIALAAHAPRLDRFLVHVGMPEIFASYNASCAAALDPMRLLKLMRSTFISYGGPDGTFAWRLRDDLARNGVRTFFFATDAVPGKRLHDVMREGVNKYDRVVVICSKASLSRPGVKNEIRETLAREAKAGGEALLIPIALDDFIFRSRSEVAAILRERVVADFRESDSCDYEESLLRLLAALRVSNPAACDA